MFLYGEKFYMVYKLNPLSKVSFVLPIDKLVCLAARCETKTRPYIKWNPGHPTVYPGLLARAG